MVVSANRLELLQIADAVAREKSIEKQIVIDAMADAIQKAARSRYGQETNIRADINPNTGEMKLQRLMEVVEDVEDFGRQIALKDARTRNETSVQVAGRKRFRGRIVATDDTGVTVETDKPALGEDFRTALPFETIAEARLVLTDDLIRDALRKDKMLREGRDEQDDGQGEEAVPNGQHRI